MPLVRNLNRHCHLTEAVCQQQVRVPASSLIAGWLRQHSTHIMVHSSPLDASSPTTSRHVNGQNVLKQLPQSRSMAANCCPGETPLFPTRSSRLASLSIHTHRDGHM